MVLYVWPGSLQNAIESTGRRRPFSPDARFRPVSPSVKCKHSAAYVTFAR